MTDNQPGFDPSMQGNRQPPQPVHRDNRPQTNYDRPFHTPQSQNHPPSNDWDSSQGETNITRSPMAAERATNRQATRESSGVSWSVIFIPILILVFGLGIVAALFGSKILGGDSDGINTDAGESTPSTADQSTATATPGDELVDNDPAAPAATIDSEQEAGTGLVVPDPDPTKMVLELNDFKFFISGVVADQATKDTIDAATVETYGKFGTSAIEVDPSITPQPWIGGAAEMIVGFWTILDGRIEITENETFIAGRSPDQDSTDAVLATIDSSIGFPQVRNEVEIIDGRLATIEAKRVDGQLTLTGELPAEILRDEIVNGTIEAFGEANVTDEIVVNPEVFERFAIILYHTDIAAYEPLGDFRVGVVGGQAYGEFDSGLNFDSSSQTLTPESAAKLTAFPPIFARSRLPITVTGYTDSQGLEADNQALSEARAQAVGDWFVSQGLDPERLIIVGKGETEPLASNDTEQGRALNRRVVFNEGF